MAKTRPVDGLRVDDTVDLLGDAYADVPVDNRPSPFAEVYSTVAVEPQFVDDGWLIDFHDGGLIWFPLGHQVLLPRSHWTGEPDL